MKNKYIAKGDIVKFQINCQGGKYWVVVDRDDFEKIKKFNAKWYGGLEHGNVYVKMRNVVSGGYRCPEEKVHVIRLHRFVLGFPDYKNGKIVIDHINKDTLDNRKENLRVVNQRENAKNRDFDGNRGVLLKSNTSGCPGVTWHNHGDRWIARLTLNYKTYCLGSFKNKTDAIKARLKGEKKYFGKIVSKIPEGVEIDDI